MQRLFIILHSVIIYIIILLIRNFDINDQDANGKTMLHYAIELKKFSKAHIIMDYPCKFHDKVVMNFVFLWYWSKGSVSSNKCILYIMSTAALILSTF